MRLRDELRRPAEHPHPPGVPGPAGRAPGARGGGGADAAASAALALGCTISPGSSLRAEELLLAPTCPRATRSASTTSRWRPTARWRSRRWPAERARILRVHMEEDAGKKQARLRRRVDRRPEPRGDAARRDRRRARPAIGRGGGRVPEAAARGAHVRGRQRREPRAGQLPLRRQRERPGKRGETTRWGRARSFEEHQLCSGPWRTRSTSRRAGQIALLERGERVRMETRLTTPRSARTYLLRDKEGEAGYRYFPEPDLPPLVLDDAFVEELRHALPPGPAASKRRLVDELGLTPQAAAVLTAHPQIAVLRDDGAPLPGGGSGRELHPERGVRDARMSGLSAEIPVSPGSGRAARPSTAGRSAASRRKRCTRMRGTPALSRRSSASEA